MAVTTVTAVSLIGAAFTGRGSVVAGGPPPTTRRARKKLETKQALEQAALRLFALRGYEQTTVEEIADAADVAVRTFFRYFSSKQEILFGDVARDRISRLSTELAARPAGESPLASIFAIMDALDISDPDEAQQIRVRINLIHAQPSLKTQYVELIDEMRLAVLSFVAERTGLDPQLEMYPLLVAGACATAWDTSLRLWMCSPTNESLCDLGREAFRQLSAGLPDPPPRPAANAP